MAKLLRSRKQFGRCRIHGCGCEVSDEIQSTPFSRAQDKREAAAEIAGELRECSPPHETE